MKKNILLITLLINIGIADVTYAQTVAQENAEADARRTIEQTTPQGQISNKPAENQCPEIQFADILKSPDNIKLNYCYALKGLQNNDYKSAASALERILLLKPYRADIRMLYASVLYRMDILDGSKKELQSMISAENKDLIDAYIKKIDKRQNPLKQTLTLSLGGHYDTNRNAAPQSDTFLVGGAPLAILNENSREDDDFGIIGSARYDIEHGFGDFNNHKALGSVVYFRDDQTTRDELDLGSFIANGGAQFDLNSFKLTALANYINMDLSKEKFYKSVGGRVRLDKQFSRGANKSAVDSWASAGLSNETYGNISENNSLRNRTGQRFDAQIGNALWLNPKHRLSGTIDFTHKDARVNFQTYNYWSATLGHVWALGSGQYLSSNASYGVRSYKGSEPFVTGNNDRDRQEKPLRLSTTYTVPVAKVLGLGGLKFSDKAPTQIPLFNNFNLSLTGEYLNQNSNITNYDYNNVRGQVLLMKRFEF